MIRSLLCKLPRWLGGGHKWRRLRKAEHKPPSMAALASYSNLRICNRCGAERVVRARKPKTEQETTV